MKSVGFWLVFLFLLFLSAHEVSALSPVTIQGKRFFAGGSPYFPSTHFLVSGGSFKFTHVYLSTALADSIRASMLQGIINSGYNSIYIYTINQNDYDPNKNGAYFVTPYVNGTKSDPMVVGGAFDNTKLQAWRTKLVHMINSNIRPVIWLFPDDAPDIARAPISELKRYIQKMTATFDDLPVMWVLALEADEYWTKTTVDDLGTYLNSITVNPVGIHQLSGRSDYMTGNWVQFGMFQYGFGLTWQQVYDRTKSLTSAFTKPIIAAEYDRDGGTAGKSMGLAAAYANAAGIGNGAPGVLDSFIESLPASMAPSQSNNMLYLTGSGVTARADMITLTFSKTTTPTNTPTLPPGIPAVSIAKPSTDGQSFPAKSTLSFTGFATDPEDGNLSGNSLTWWIDRLGDGYAEAKLSVTGTSGSQLLSGSITNSRGQQVQLDMVGPEYRLILKATDSDGNTSQTRRVYYLSATATTPVPTKTPTLGPTNTPTTVSKPGDANGDGRVDLLDYVIWLSRYGAATSNGPRDGDFNRDSKVDLLDYVIWLNNFGK